MCHPLWKVALPFNCHSLQDPSHVTHGKLELLATIPANAGDLGNFTEEPSGISPAQVFTAASITGEYSWH